MLYEVITKSKEEVKGQIDKLLTIKGKKTPSELHRELGKVMWEDVGMARSDASLKHALKRIPEIRDEFWNNVNVTGGAGETNQHVITSYSIHYTKLYEAADFETPGLSEFACPHNSRNSGRHPIGDSNLDIGAGLHVDLEGYTAAGGKV